MQTQQEIWILFDFREVDCVPFPEFCDFWDDFKLEFAVDFLTITFFYSNRLHLLQKPYWRILKKSQAKTTDLNSHTIDDKHSINSKFFFCSLPTRKDSYENAMLSAQKKCYANEIFSNKWIQKEFDWTRVQWIFSGCATSKKHQRAKEKCYIPWNVFVVGRRNTKFTTTI